MGLFSRWRGKSSEDKDNAQLIRRLDGRLVKYVTTRDPETSVESVIGHSGRINTLNGQITIVCNGTEVFRCDSQEASCGELMSLNGVVIQTGSGADKRVVVAYYQYYR